MTLSFAGAGDSRPLTPWFMRLMIKLTNFKITFADHDAQESLSMESGLDWVIARPVALNNKEETKELQISYGKTPSPFSISRKRLAMFMVDCLSTNDFVHKAPLLSKKAR
ncbi:NAD(P)H-binding protein [Spirosoma arcticum]